MASLLAQTALLQVRYSLIPDGTGLAHPSRLRTCGAAHSRLRVARGATIEV